VEKITVQNKKQAYTHIHSTETNSFNLFNVG
jgi:hypothetical protein